MSADGDGSSHIPLNVQKQATWRVIRPLNEVRRVRTKRSLLSLIFGQGSAIEGRVFQWGVRDGWPLRVLWASWYIGAVIGFLALVHAIHPKCVWASALMIPLPMVTLALLSKDLVLEILVELDFYIMQILQAITLMHAMEDTWKDMPWGRLRCNFWFFCLPSFLVAPLVDAYPAKFRPHFLQLYFSGMSAILLCWHAIHLYQHSFKLLSYKLGDLLTLTLFYFRQIYVASCSPDYFVLITCRMYTEHDVIKLSEDGSGVEAGDVKRVRVVPPRSYSFRASSRPVSSMTDSEGAGSDGSSPDEDERDGASQVAADAAPLSGLPPALSRGHSTLSRMGSASLALEPVKEEIEHQGSSESDAESSRPTGP